MAEDTALAPPPPSAKLGPELRPVAASYVATYVGDGLFYVTAALYFTQVVGLSPVVYGAALTVAWLVAMGLSVPVGHLADRFDPRTVTAVLLVLTGLATCVYLFTHQVLVFFAAACVFTTCTEGTHSARSALIGRTFPADQVTRVRAILISASNAGLALGAALGALTIASGTAGAYRLGFALDAVTFFLSAALLLKVPSPKAPQQAEEAAAEPAGGSLLGVFRDRGYVLLGVLNMLMTLHIPLTDVALPLWVVRQTHAPAWSIAVLFVVNTTLVVLFQYRLAKGVASVDDGVRGIRLAGVLLFAGMALYSVSGMPSSPWAATALLVAAAAVLTFGEMRQTATMMEISFRLVPGERYGQYQGFFGMGSTLSEAVGPLVLTWLVLYQRTWGWLLLGVVFLAAGLAVRHAVDLARRAPLMRENAL
ncbi:MFS transporter [Streptomyces sp. NPDC047017]|uniref:MFS transporter n=1 Tax=Streptomyces sp. NPDC047017 TaxID=3155024 RepID=UPI0033FE5BB6